MNIQGKVVLITGASRGIGRAIALELAKKGARRLILVARNPYCLAEVAKTARSLGAEAIPLTIDLTSRAEVSSKIAKAWRDYGDVDLLVNCAGVAHQAPFMRSRLFDVQKEMSTNMMGLYLVTSLIARRMAARRSGTIAVVSSLMGKIAAPTMATYSATKFATVGFSRALRLELAPHNVKVMTLLPTLTDTDMVKNFKKFRGVVPVSAQQVAKAFVQGVRDESSEVLVGWQSHLAVWCDRFLPRLLEWVIKMSAPRLIPTRQPPRVSDAEHPRELAYPSSQMR